MSVIRPERAALSPKEHRMSPNETAVLNFAGPIKRVVQSHRDRGFKAAVSYAAQVFGLEPRRVRAACHDEVRSPKAWELDQVRARYRAWIEQKTVALEAEIERLRAERREMEGDGT